MGDPGGLLQELNAEFGFTLDVCATPENAKCSRFFTLAEDGLTQSWASERCWMNPPYSAIGRWLEKAWQASRAGALVVALVPARTDTRWWHEWALKGVIRYVPGRLRFGAAKDPAPFPSAVVIFRPPDKGEPA